MYVGVGCGGVVSRLLVCLRVRPTSSEQVILKARCGQCPRMLLEGVGGEKYSCRKYASMCISMQMCIDVHILQ